MREQIMKFTFAPETRPLSGYTIKRAIHRGGFGEVYYALSDAGKEVALKLLNNNLAVELRGVSQCLNLKHPNLVTIFDIREDADHDHWIVMEYVGGRGLYDVLQKYRSDMPISEILFWLSGISSGLSFLHDRGIVHRDLKPANVFSDNGVVKIGDVGLSKYISDSRRSAQTQSVGTVYYMAPEVARGRYGREVDVYALGIMLVEMLTGHVPFEGETTAEILMKHMTTEPDLTVLPPALRPVLAAALEKDPARRTSTVEELERQFRQAVVDNEKSAAAGTAAAGAAGKPAGMPAGPPVSSPEMTRRHVTRATGPHHPPFAPAPAENPRRSPAPDRSADTTYQPAQPLVRYWQDDVPTPVKWILCGALFVLATESGILRPVAGGGLFGGIAYLAWRSWQKLFGRTETGSRPHTAVTPEVTFTAATDAPPGGASATHPDARHDRPRAHARTEIMDHRPGTRSSSAALSPGASVIYSPATARQIPMAQRIVDICCSMSIALLAVVLVTVAVRFATDLLPQPVHMTFFGTVALLAAWALIVSAKIWEGRQGDALGRRVVLFGAGLAVGAFAWQLKDFLLLTDHALVHVRDAADGEQIRFGRLQITDPDGRPTMACFMLFFGILFAARQWWWQIDSFRKSRFRVLTSLTSLLLGAVLSGILRFPENLGVTWALAISAVVQLSAGWTPPEDRCLVPAPDTDAAPPRAVPARHPVAVSAGGATGRLT